MRIMKHIAACAAATAVAFSADAAFTTPYELQIDVNGLTMDAGGSFNANTYTGTLVITSTASSSLTSVLIDGAVQGVSATLAGFSGEVTMNAGAITGGSFLVQLSDGSSYSADLDPAFATIFQAGGEHIGDGDTAGGAFAGLGGGTSFGGVDVSPWSFGAARGFFFIAGFTPGATGFSSGVDINLWVLVPSPGVGVFAAAGLFAGLRRRR